MKNKIKYFIITFSIMIILTSCNKNEYKKHSNSFFNTFDTVIDFTAYTKSEDEFNKYYNIVYEEFGRLHKLYDNFNEYEEIANIKTININAGVAPVKVDKDIIELVKFSLNMSGKYGYETNIAFGPVLEIWHNYREQGILNPKEAKIPSMEDLERANKITNPEDIIINEEENTIFLKYEGMSLDTGAISKGYAAQKVMDKVKEAGCESAILSAGGNIISLGHPKEEDRDEWGIGIQNPDLDNDESLLDIVYGNGIAVVTSGDYQRFFEVGGVKYNHIIDPSTLMPANNFRAVTVIAKDSGIADFFSTTLFILNLEEGQNLIKDLDIEVMWVNNNGEIVVTKGMENYLKSYRNK